MTSRRWVARTLPAASCSMFETARSKCFGRLLNNGTAYRQLLAVDQLEEKLRRIFADLDYDNVANLATCVHRTLTFHQGYSYLFH